MGNYNPYAPVIVGQEWVPIREEVFELAPDLNVIEQGHGFKLLQTRLIHDVRFYTPSFPPGSATGQVFIASIYPRGTEDLTGPIQSVVIPCNSASVTGGTPSSTAVQDLMDPSDDLSVLLNGDANDKLECFFATNQYTFLQGKRILGIELLYTAYTQSDTPIESYFATISIRNDAGTSQSFGAPEAYVDTTTVKTVFTRSLGDVNHFALGNPSASSERLPYRYVDLQRFEATSTNTRLRVMFATTSFGDTDLNDNLFIGYAALRVWYCEEKRVAVGAVIFGNVTGGKDFKLGVNDIPMRDISGYATDPPLVAGDYDVTISAGNPSSFNFGGATTSSGIYPPIESLRELYEIPPHPGVKVNVPQRIVGNDETFTAEVTHILPHLSVHTTGGAPLTEVHVYGRQAVARVYGSTYALADVDDDVVPTPGGSYPQVRYYARRFGQTVQPLVLTETTSPATTGHSVYITPADFDELDEIVDGWKEITLRFTSAPTIISSGPTLNWKWTATGESAGNRWEVLGVRAPAVSGIPGNLTQEVPAGQRLGIATYHGATTTLTWAAPPVSGIASDASADGVILFSLDPPTVTGVTVTTQYVPVSGIGTVCGVVASCSPTGVAYHHLTWPIAQGYAALTVGRDEFERVGTGVGTPDEGGSYVTQGTITDYATDGHRMLITPTTADSRRYGVLAVGSDFDVTLEGVSVVGTLKDGTTSVSAGVIGRLTSSTDYYLARVTVTSSYVLQLTLEKRVADVTSTVVNYGDLTALGLSGGFDSRVNIRFMGWQTYLKVKVWRTGDPEPDYWLIETTDSSLTTGNNAGFYAISSGAASNVIALDRMEITPPAYWFGAYEIQRQDDVDVDWQTVMRSTSPGVTSFNDYEARVGIESRYRVRQTNVYDFAGSWSTTVASTLAAPGVVGTTRADGVLIFTTNEVQDGSSVLAYVETWERVDGIKEDFIFPEADTVVLQRMYGKDFQTAFRPLERGGEQFARTLQLQNAAVATHALDRIADGLRNLAWADVSYVCVRTEDGDRWLATVIVPDATARKRRELQLVRVVVIETTDTPSPVDTAV